jgi:hypothetical protein
MRRHQLAGSAFNVLKGGFAQGFPAFAWHFYIRSIYLTMFILQRLSKRVKGGCGISAWGALNSVDVAIWGCIRLWGQVCAGYRHRLKADGGRAGQEAH